MKSPTKKITTPIAGVEVEIKDWITGADAEKIDQALMAGVEVKPDIARKTASINKFDTKVINEQTHEEIIAFVISVNGQAEKVLEEVMSLPEDDYNFIIDAIAERRTSKKKLEPETVGPLAQ